MDSGRRRALGIAGAVAGVGAAGAGFAVRKFVVGRRRPSTDPEAGEPLGRLRGRPRIVLAEDGVPLHVEVEGPDDPELTVLFCHGVTLTQDSWHYQRRDLRGEGRIRRVFWDQRGHGRSGQGGSAEATIDQTGRDLYAVLRATTRPEDPVVLAGHSMGGMTAMALADQHPELFGDQIAGVALINTSTGKLRELTLGLPMAVTKAMRPLAPGVVRQLGRRGRLVDRGRGLAVDLAYVVTRWAAFADPQVSPSVVEFLEAMIRATPMEVIAAFYPTLMEHDKERVAMIIGRAPVLVMVGGQDRITPPEHGRALAEATPGAELVETGQAGHVLPLEHPGEVTAGLRRLIERARPVAEERSA